jgi:transposase
MREGITVEVSAVDRARLEAVVADRNSRQKHVWRAKIVLTTAEGCGTAEIVRRTGKSKPCVWRWQERFMREGVEGLLRDKSRKPGIPPLPAAIVDRVVGLTLGEPPGEATHWTGRAMAKTVVISLRSVQRIWRAHRLAPHRERTFKLSRDPAFVPRLRDVVGLYVHPPAHAIVLSMDEKSQIQALERTQPGLPLKEGRPATATHDYERHGTTTLFAALNVLDGSVIGRCMQRHRHQEFLRFLNAIEAAVPAGKLVHAILDNYGTHKHPKVLAWLARHPRWIFHFTPTSCSWLNAVEGFFAKLTRRRLRRGSFPSLVALQEAINRFVEEHNRDPRPFVWTADPNASPRRSGAGIMPWRRCGCRRAERPHAWWAWPEGSALACPWEDGHGGRTGRAAARRHPGGGRGRLLGPYGAG